MSVTQAQRAIDSLFAHTAESVPAAEQQLIEMAAMFSQSMAKAVAPVINEFISNCAPACLEDCQTAATHVNHMLEMTGQCIVVEGKPALLVGEQGKASRPESGHLALLVNSGKRAVAHIPVDCRSPGLVVMPLNAVLMDGINQLYSLPQRQRSR